MATAKSPPFQKFYFDDFILSTDHLTTTERGAYWLLMGRYWTHGGPLPDDDGWLHNAARCGPGQWKRIKSKIMAFFRLQDGLWRHDRIERELAEAREAMRWKAASFRRPRLVEHCESPIERQLATALESAWWPAGVKVEVRAQVKVYSYRVDFLLFARLADYTLKIVIECDGHDFHERTKEQAKHDRKRDRRMIAGGYPVFRFTGSEIFDNASKCVGEIRHYLEDEEQRMRPST